MSKLPDHVVAKAREADIVTLIDRYVKLEKAGHEYRGLCPFHNEKSPSFTVTEKIDDSGIGRYHCFGCGANGGTIQFVMDYEGTDFRTAVQRINGDAEASPEPARERRTIEREEPDLWTPLAEVPETAPQPMDVINRKIGGRWAKLTANMHWAYRDAVGNLIGYIYRFNLPAGGKEVVPQTYCVNQTTGELSWRWLSFGKPRPIYGLDLLAANPNAQVLVVEGEKACDAARALLASLGIPPSKLIVISWPGGGKAIKHVDWSPLFRRSVALWPDADQKTYVDRHPKAGELMPFIEQPGAIAMRDLHAAIAEHCPPVKIILPPAGVPDGWDLADPLPEGFQLLTHMKAAAQLAYDLFLEPQPEPEPDPDLPPWEGEDEIGAAAAAEVQEPAPPAAPAPATRSKAKDFDSQEDRELGANPYFRVLGYDHERYFILSHEKRQILVYTKSDFSEAGLLELAPLDWWELNFESTGKQAGINKKAAMNWIVRKAHSRGVYSMTRLRGRGAWTDKGRLVFHHGDYLTVDGKSLDITEMDSYYVYEMAEALPAIPETAMTCEEGQDLLDLVSIFRWAKPASAPLLAGWVALAPIGGAIKWRPHVWMTGGTGSGKTTLLNRVVHHLMNGIDVYANGNSTEAGIRQRLKGDSRPVLFDESESNTEKEGLRIQQVLAMVRQASTESPAETLKGTAGGDAMSFLIRSMFCLASVQVGIKYQADVERMTVLSLLPKHMDATPDETWERMDQALHVMQRDETLPGRLVRRSIELLPITLQNIKTFAKAAAIKFGNQRDGDQYGTLMAGAWSLVSNDLIPLDVAQQWIDTYDWSEHRENNETGEGERALAALMGALVRVHGGASVTVHELVLTAKGYHVEGLTMQAAAAEAMLQRHGMRTDGNRLVLSNNSTELRRLMEGTPFESDLRGVMLRLEGADRYANRTVKFSGVGSKAISIPLDDLLEDADQMPARETEMEPF